MTFTDPQLRKLRAALRPEHVRERHADGRTLHYIEGWYAVAEANRIFGFDGWDRETLTSQCVWQKQTEGQYGAAYLARVRLTVRAGDLTVVREGFGSGEAYAPTPGQAHDRAAKAAETDATKRALSTFGNPFGLSLYKDKQEPARRAQRRAGQKAAPASATPTIMPVGSAGLNRDPRPSAEAIATAEHMASHPGYEGRGGRVSPPSVDLVQLQPAPIDRVPVDKSLLPIGEPKRFRSPDHLKFVASQPCLVCGRQPSQAHHLRYTQPRAVGRKVSDEYTVPLCTFHHDEVHRTGNEYGWWRARSIDPLKIARDLWDQSKAPLVEDHQPAAE